MQREYLDIGCGPNLDDRFVNLDLNWRPGLDVCWDLTRLPLPFANDRFKGVFTEHCYEHLPFEAFRANMREIHRILRPGGVLRLIMPDGELYLDIYQERKQGGTRRMPYEEHYLSPMHRINGIFRNHGHQFIYDMATVDLLLREAGFGRVERSAFGTSRDPVLMRDSAWRADESLYVEATK